MRIPLHDLHVSLGARMVSFAGWDMPVQYSSIKEEHHAVRSSCGLFDVSHMGEFVFQGDPGIALLQYLTTNDVHALDVGHCHYTFILNESGGTVDDAMVYRVDEQKYIVVVNAGNIEKDWDHVQGYLSSYPGADARNASGEYGLFALQGPKSFEIASKSVGQSLDMPFHSLIEAEIAGNSVLLAASGYTGENGLEVFVDGSAAEAVWEALSEAEEVTPCGLGARDTLRLEASLALYGHELDEETTPIEAGLGFAVSKSGEYVGCDAVEKQRQEGPQKRLVLLEMVDRAIPRQGYEIVSAGGDTIGVVTSGSLAPWLGKNIGMGYITPDVVGVGTEVGIRIRDRVVKAVQVKRPFYKRPKR